MHDRRLLLYRGIAVPSFEARHLDDRIRAAGLSGKEGRWQFLVPEVARLQEMVDSLFQKSDLTHDELFADAKHPGICACGDFESAAYYACVHNRSKTHDCPVVIEFFVPHTQVYVDPRDFLCTVFQFWNRRSTAFVGAQEEVLARIYGPHIKRYFKRARDVSDQAVRIAMCDLACFDTKVILGHYDNDTVIQGRYGVIFKSAFFVQGPVLPSQIRDVHVNVSYRAVNPKITLSAVLEGHL